MKTKLSLTLILSFCATLPACAEDWTPGTPSKDWPHVVTGEKPGTYQPEAGWKFATEESGDFSVLPLDAVTAKIPAIPQSIEIHPPEGFWTPEENSEIAVLLNAEAEADEWHATIAHWMRVDNNRFYQAAVKVRKTWLNKRLSLSAFSVACSEIKQACANQEQDSIVKDVAPVFDKLNGSVLSNKTVAVAGCTLFPPHHEDRKSLAWSLVRKDVRDENGNPVIDFCINVCAMVWLRGNVVNLYVGYNVNDENDVDKAVADAKGMMSKWLSSIEAKYPQNEIEGDNANILADKDSILSGQERGEKQIHDGTKKIIWGIIIFVILGQLGKRLKNKAKANKNISSNEWKIEPKPKRNWFATLVGIIAALLAYAFVRGLVSSWLSK